MLILNESLYAWVYAGAIISKHHMLILNPIKVLIPSIIKYFKTSYVDFKPMDGVAGVLPQANFKTSYVDFKHKNVPFIFTDWTNFKTSYVDFKLIQDF